MARLTLAESTVYAPVWYALVSRSSLAPSSTPSAVWRSLSLAAKEETAAWSCLETSGCPAARRAGLAPGAGDAETGSGV
jgi:hypothetical protein